MIYLTYFPIIFISLALIIFQINPDFYNLMFGILEGGFFEWVQFFCYLFAVFVTVQCILKNKSQINSMVNILLSFFAIGCLFIALEEISYGQHIFKWETPTHFTEINGQRETNLHNLKFIMENQIQHIAFVIVGLFGAFSSFFRVNSNLNLHWRDILFVNKSLALYFLPVAAFYIHISTGGKGHHFQELFETVLGFGFLLIAIFNFKTVQSFQKSKFLKLGKSHPVGD